MADKQNLPPLRPPKFDIKKTVGYQKRIKEIGGRPTRNVYDYPTVFTRDNYTPATPPQYQEETAAGLENYDKLTQAERTLYGMLPGFAESSVGKALERFSGGRGGEGEELGRRGRGRGRWWAPLRGGGGRKEPPFWPFQARRPPVPPLEPPPSTHLIAFPSQPP